MPHDDIPNMFGRGCELTLISKFLFFFFQQVKPFCTWASILFAIIDDKMNSVGDV